MTLPLSPIELFALGYFFLLWIGYSHYARYQARKNRKVMLSRSLRDHREAWAARLLDRDVRMTDASLLANQERVVGFFASTTLLLLAAVLTALTTSETIANISSHIPFTEAQTSGQVEAKFFLLLLILIYAFFKVTWSLRQYGFAAVVIGSAPMPEEHITAQQRQDFICNLGKLMDYAGHDNNSCLRAYYFGLSVVCWLAGTLIFVGAATLTVVVLYNREFGSDAVASIKRSFISYEKDSSSGA